MKTTVITGASSGIGAELARQLASKGFNVVLAARRDHELREIADEIGASAYAVVTDVRSRIDIENLKNAAIDKFGAIDIWVNNAGRGICRNVLELSDEDFDEIINVNLKSALYGMQSIIPYFIERGARALRAIPIYLQRFQGGLEYPHREFENGYEKYQS